MPLLILQRLKLIIGLMKSFKITEANSIIWALEGMVPGTIALFLILKFCEIGPDYSTHTIIIVNRAFNTWIVFLLGCFLSIILRDHKKIILKIDNRGMTFRKDGYIYEYDWEEIEYVYEQPGSALSRKILQVKVYDIITCYSIDLDGCISTFLPVRIAFKHFSKGSVKYYTKREWKKNP